MDTLKGIKNIIFDLGGVVINLDFKRTVKEFNALGLVDIDKVYTQNRQLPWFDNYDIGKISSETFLSELSKHLSPGTTNDQIIHAWNAMLLDFPKERARLLLDLRSRYRTFLLSNTNEIHIGYYLDLIRKWYGEDAMERFFEKTYYSNRIGMRKPEKETFEFVINENALITSETMFIDDTLQHVEGARLAGLRAYHLQAPETIIDLFGSHGISDK